MNHGQQTVKAARRLACELGPSFTVYYAHGKRASDSPDRMGNITVWLGERKQGNELAQLDIAVEHAGTDRTIALIEVEEGSRSRDGKPTGAAPKVLLADLLATLLGDEITFGEKALHKTLNVGPHTTLIVLTVESSEAKREQMKELEERVRALKEHLASGNRAIGRIVVDTYPAGKLLAKLRELVVPNPSDAPQSSTQEIR